MTTGRNDAARSAFISIGTDEQIEGHAPEHLIDRLMFELISAALRRLDDGPESAIRAASRYPIECRHKSLRRMSLGDRLQAPRRASTGESGGHGHMQRHSGSAFMTPSDP
jgi:hypothetical protein